MYPHIPNASGLPITVLLVSLFLPIVSSAPPQIKTTKLPTIALVPGAWHSPVHYTELTTLLTFGGYNVVSRRLPSCDSKNPDAESVATDAAAIRDNLLLPQIDRGNEVVLVMHSYGGAPGSMAGKGLSISERRVAGKPGGIIGLIVLCGFLANTGQSLLSSLPGQVFDPWVVQYDDGQLGTDNPGKVFYNDVPKDVASFAISKLRNQSRKALESPSGPPAWADSAFNGRRSYLHTLLDNGIPPPGQDAMIQASGVEWNIETFNTSHSPYLSEPYQVAAWIRGEIQRFTNLK